MFIHQRLSVRTMYLWWLPTGVREARSFTLTHMRFMFLIILDLYRMLSEEFQMERTFPLHTQSSSTKQWMRLEIKHRAPDWSISEVWMNEYHLIIALMPFRRSWLTQNTPKRLSICLCFIHCTCHVRETSLFTGAKVDHNPDHMMFHSLPLRKQSVHALRPRVHDRGRRQDV